MYGNNNELGKYCPLPPLYRNSSDLPKPAIAPYQSDQFHMFIHAPPTPMT
jgi:hypothetical protein